MKIIALTAENVKKLVAVHIEPNGNMVQITGKNGQGKTSVLDAIWWALEGATHIQATPIRKGATEARIRLDLGELIVTRKFKAKEEGGYTTTIAVETADGAKYSSPQAVLDKLIGHLSFDPLAFTRMESKDQVKALQAFVPGVDFAAIERAQKADFDARTAVNRRVKDLRAQADGIAIPADAPKEAVDETALVAKLESAGQHNADIEKRRGNREKLADHITSLRAGAAEQIARAEKLEAEAAAERRVAAANTKEADDGQAKLDAAPALPAPIDTTAVRTEIETARRSNAVFAQRNHRIDIVAQADKAEVQAKALTEAMAKRETDKQAKIAAAALPVQGLGFGDGVVTLDGLPFDQASDAQQLRASIAIAAAMNPKLRVIRVRDGSLLDDEAMQQLATYAAEHDLQVWIERVDSTGKVGFVLEDGHVRGQKAPAEAVAGEAA
jgi:DNA repair exonuclease SbcCD ATPase subunit